MNLSINRMVGLPVFILCLLASGCTIVQNVESVGPGVGIAKIYVEENEAVHMDAMDDAIVSQIRELGFEAEKFNGELPKDAQYYLTFTANWKWDMAMYLTYFKANLYENGRVIGSTVYDARKGSGNMGKFGKTAEKIRPLLEELLKDVQRESSSSSLGSS